MEISTVIVHYHQEKEIISGAEAATERSEGVAGAERMQAPVNLPQGEPSIRAKRVVGETRRA